MRNFTTIATAILLARSVIGGFANLGCMNPDYMNSTYMAEQRLPIVNVITSVGHPADSYIGCPTYCVSLVDQETRESAGDFWPIESSTYRPGVGGAAGECYCLDHNGGLYSEFAIVLGDGPYGDCFPEDFQLVFTHPDNIELISCIKEALYSWDDYTEVGGSDFGIIGNVFLDTRHPAPAWKEFEFVYLEPTPHRRPYYGWMWMTTPNGRGPPEVVTCGPGVGRLYRRSTGNTPSPSGLARRRTVAARAIIQAELATFRDCPRGLEACSIPGSGRAYECLDTSTELEACGGCVDGYFDEQMGTGRAVGRAVGTDCSTIDGVALGGVSCVGGRCQVTSCRRGYRLQNGRCVA